MVKENNKKYDIKYTFEKLQEAYNRLDVKDSKDYFLTLGNVNEVHLLKKDATKSVFLGKMFTHEDDTQTEEARKIWEAIKRYFGANVTTVAKVEEVKEVEETPAVTKKVTTRKPKKVEEIQKAEDIEVDEADEDSDWVDTVL